MWMVAYVAQSLKTAERIKELILAKGLLVKVRAINASRDEEYGCYEILVPEAELGDAHNIIISEGIE